MSRYRTSNSPFVAKEYYVYHWCYGDGRPFYIGMGTGERWKSRLGRNHRVKNIMIQIRRGGGTIIRKVVIGNLTREEAWAEEIRQIAQYGRACVGEGCLANVHPGGQIGKERKNRRQ